MMKKSLIFDPIKVDYLYKGIEPLEVRCFLVSHGDGLILIDAGVADDVKNGKGSIEQIEAALAKSTASWADISDVIVTHAHADHFGALADVAAKIPSTSRVWAGFADIQTIKAESRFKGEIEGLGEGDYVRVLRAKHTRAHRGTHLPCPR